MVEYGLGFQIYVLGFFSNKVYKIRNTIFDKNNKYFFHCLYDNIGLYIAMLLGASNFPYD